MKHKIIIFALSFLPLFSYSYQENHQGNIKWKANQTIQLSKKETLEVLNFDGAVYSEDNGFLPVYFKRIKLNLKNPDVSVTLKNKIFEEFQDKQISKIKNLNKIKDRIFINTKIAYERKIPYVLVFFIPIKENSITGKYEKLLSFEIELNIKKSTEKEYVQKHIYSNNSVLSQGDWYKIRVNKTGIYKITYTDLENMGIDLASVNPKNIKIYANGPGMLPENTSAFYYDDLMENAIIVKGEDDGSFDENDYILFYGQAPTIWQYNKSKNRFEHKVNLYSDYTYYFICIASDAGKRIENQTSSALEPTNYVNRFNDYAYHEIDQLNFLKSGREWYGEVFDAVTSYDFSFSFPNIDSNSDVYLKSSVAAKSDINSSFKITVNGNVSILTVSAAPSGYDRIYAKTAANEMSFKTSKNTIDVKIEYNKTTQSSMGWLNYLELNAVRYLKFNGGQMQFRDINSVGENNISEFTLSNATTSVNIWDVTKPINVKKIDAAIIGDKMTFTVPTDSLREFIAFDGSSYYSAEFVGKINNQNLHAFTHCDLIIVSHPDFIDQAKRLAKIHENIDSLKVIVVSTQQIYNEFSSGAQDISAIRNFAKMLYDNADKGNEPKFLLLFGDGSYDNKNRINDNTNFIPTYQSVESLSPTGTYVSDDFYGYLDNNEGNNKYDLVDIGVGRLPVKTEEEAKNAVDKIERYTSQKDLVDENTASNIVSNFADWRNTVCFVCDDQDKSGDTFLDQSEQIASMIDTNNKVYNIDKIYSDAFQQITTPAGQRYPGVNKAIDERVDNGALIINYIGHGGELGWSLERILEISDINGWCNRYNMPVFVTATCEFSRFDDPERTSAGELVFLKPNGGGISLFSTTRPTFGGSNIPLIKSFFGFVFKTINHKHLRLGDIIMLSKRDNPSTNSKKFILLGDPALKLAYPKNNIITTSINNHNVGASPDTIKAFDKVNIKGEIQDHNGNKINNFNGIIYPTVFDKPEVITSYGHDIGHPTNFNLQKNIVYKGKASVVNGCFSFNFIVPKDISYQYGFGKISYYAQNGTTDANGYNKNIVIGGFNKDFIEDNDGPNINLYMNDENFVSGGMTDENPILLAFISDSSGINTVGNGIGHDIVAVLDNDYENSEVLNNYYESNLDSYKQGIVKYQYINLSEGIHTLNLKVWDIYNNSSEADIEFFVNNSGKLVLDHLMNYPNPFRATTSFVFNHNQPDASLNIKIQIFSMNGSLVKTIEKTIISEGFKSEPIDWDGRNDSGNKLSRGIYIYKLSVRNNDGFYSSKTQKLIILN